MPNPNADFPTIIHVPVDAPALTDVTLGGSNPTHPDIHGKVEQELVAIQTKLGIGAAPASAATAGDVLTKQADGSTSWGPQATVDTGMVIQDQELTSTYAYIGYEHESDGSWFIYRRTRATNVRQYKRGVSDYPNNWNNRAGLVYS